MNARGGAHRGRGSRAGPNGTGAEKSQPGPASLPPSTQADVRGEGQGLPLPPPTTSTSSSPSVPAAANEFTIIAAILGSRNNARLDAVQRLLKQVVSNATTVVRGTDSQRRFTSAYTEFCASALRCMADLEDAVYEYTHPTKRAADAADDEVDGIAEEFFLKQVAAYVATHTKSLGLAYLEHVALGALEKQQQQRKRERTASAGSGSGGSAGQRVTKAGRLGAGHSGAGSRSSTAGISASGASADSSSLDTLGLIDAQDTMREALRIIEQTTNATAAASGLGGGGGGEGKRRGPQAVTAALGKTYTEGRTNGLFVSKATSSGAGNASSGGAQAVFDLRNPQLKLSSIPELAPRLQPWLLPITASGVYLERVTMERERKSASTAAAAGPATGSTAIGGGGQHAHQLHQGPHTESSRTTLDVCLASTPMELLRQYEAHEAVLAAEPQPWLPTSPALSAGPYSVVPYAGKRSGAGSGASPRATANLPSALSTDATATATTTTANAAIDASGDTDAVTSALVDADPLSGSAFFPAARENRTLTCLPSFVISNVSLFGVSRMEFVYTMAPPPK